MKKYFRISAITLPVLSLLAGVIIISITGTSCNKADSATKFGLTYIYIPQSTVSDGQNTFYPVPTGYDSNSYNYSIDTINKVVNVFLGVTRSGLQSSSGYKVSLTTNADTVNQLIQAGAVPYNDSTVTSVSLLPDSAYSLPSSVTVPAGSVTGNFYLSIKTAALKSYANQVVTLCISLSNNTNYMLSPTNSQVIVAIDVNKLNLP